MPDTPDTPDYPPPYPPPPASLPRHPRRQRFARWLLSRFGWSVRFDGLPGPAGILLVYPHTSNWDFILGLLAKWQMDRPYRFVAKDSLFRGLAGATVGRLLRRWGGWPVDRSQKSGIVEQLAEAMRTEPFFWVAITPEGTRGYTDYWRSGFYHLARRADVPVALACIDYGRREASVTEFVRVTGDVDADLGRMRAYYAGKVARRPESAGRIAFRERPES